MPQVARREDLLDRERGGQKIERPEALAGAGDLAGDVVSLAQLGWEVGRELVADHQTRRRERLDSREHGLEEELVVARTRVDGVGALLERDEVGDRTLGVRAHHHTQVRQPPDEQRVAGAQHVVGWSGELGQRDDERGCVLAPVGARGVGVEEVEHHGHLGPGLRDLGVPLVEHRAPQAVREPAHPVAGWFTAPREGAGDDSRTVDETDAERLGGHERSTWRRVTGRKRTWVALTCRALARPRLAAVRRSPRRKRPPAHRRRAPNP